MFLEVLTFVITFVDDLLIRISESHLCSLLNLAGFYNAVRIN